MDGSFSQTSRFHALLTRAGLAVAGAWLAVVMPLTAQNQPGPAGPNPAPLIMLDEFRPLHAAGAVLVIDVRGADVFRNGRIPHAINVPIAAVSDRSAEIAVLAKGRPIVTYCSCPGELSSLAAVDRLASRGVTRVRALVGGYPAWTLGGGAVEK